MNNPNPESLIELCLTISNDKNEISHQIPHFIFPFIAISVSVIPRLLILIFNHNICYYHYILLIIFENK